MLAQNNDKAPVESPTGHKQTWITIFIHGIITIKPHLSFANIIKFVRDKVADSMYAQSIEAIRKDPYYHQHHAMQGVGLEKIDLNKIERGAGSTAFARVYQEISALNAPEEVHNIYYTFGWSGLLSSKMRYLESEVLYNNLIAELKNYHQEGIFPKVRIIGYSHGGNIALGMGAFYNQQEPLTINELILIGSPVIPDTDHYITSPLFKKKYHFYSTADRVQNLDFFSFNRFLSDRSFKKSRNYDLPSDLTQIELKFVRPARFASSYQQQCTCSGKFCKRSSATRRADPGHTELWSFGWTPENYRPTLPIYPLPAAAFVTYINQSIANTPFYGNHITLDINPVKGIMRAIDKKTGYKKDMPFVSKEYIQGFESKLEPFIPKDYSANNYSARLKNTITQAHNKQSPATPCTHVHSCKKCKRTLNATRHHLNKK